MNYWLIKSEPEEYSWDSFVAEGRAAWTGIRNAQARNHLRNMKRGDQAFFYHTGKVRAIVGIAKVVRESYPDPSAPEWLAVDFVVVRALPRAVELARIKEQQPLTEMVLVRQARLSVQPVLEKQWRYVLQMSR